MGTGTTFIDPAVRIFANDSITKLIIRSLLIGFMVFLFTEKASYVFMNDCVLQFGSRLNSFKGEIRVYTRVLS
jgi:hypothetical protein